MEWSISISLINPLGKKSAILFIYTDTLSIINLLEIYYNEPISTRKALKSHFPIVPDCKLEYHLIHPLNGHIL
jgi:hypothetical protein